MDERGHEYEEPWAGPLPDGSSDPEWDAYVAWRDREISAGRDEVPPEEWEVHGPAATVSLGDAADVDPALLAAVCGPDGLGGEALDQQFGQGHAADTLRPGPVLAALTEQVTARVGNLSDNELAGVLQASRRLAAREAWRQAVVIAEFARRRDAEFEDARSRGVPTGCSPGGFPGEELAIELVTTRGDAGSRIDTAADLAARLPATLAGMANGLIDEGRADVIAFYTHSLTAVDAALADETLAAVAPCLRVDQLARKAAALELKLAPGAVKARKEHARRTAQRVEAGRELSGNASLSGRELDTADAMASKAYIDAIAVKLRNGGLAGPLGTLRALALIDLTQGRSPLDRLNPDPAGDRDDPCHDAPGQDGPLTSGEGADEDVEEADEDADLTRRTPVRPGNPVPPPALINLVIPAGTLLGWSTAPGQAGRWGLLDPEETRRAVAAAARHPRTRWSLTVTDPVGKAIAHGRARGRRPGLLDGLARRQPPDQLGELLRRLGATLDPIAQAACDHRHAEDGYTPSRKLRDLVRIRTSRCTAPGCDAHASYSDLDHTIPWPNGPTDECNLGPKCRRHHRCKQAPGWKVGQPEPGVFRWTLPNGRVHTTTPATYGT